MVFSSVEFLWFFMPVVLGLYLLVAPRHRNLLLALVSLVFYAWGAHAVVLALVASIIGNFLVGLVIDHYRTAGRERAAAWALGIGVAVNLGLLFAWKYTVFAVQQLDDAIGWVGNGSHIAVPSILLPIGISFFTFHAISYLVDISRGDARPMRRLRDFAQYMAFFPQLIAGPIIRYHHIEDQIRTPPPRNQRLDDIAAGFPRFAWGLSKKVLIADQVAPIANACFTPGVHLTTPAAWLGALAYTVQIYFDFSGYTDMAIGLGRMFGFRFPENFDRPYSSVSLTDFWRRWHMSLSLWFRDYVYIPIGGNRGTRPRTTANLMFVFLLTGLWHGAAWTFVLWGAYHGGLLVFERLTGLARLPDREFPEVRRAATLVLVVIGWVIFRATSLAGAGHVLGAMASLNFTPLTPSVRAALTGQAGIALLVGLVSCLFPRDVVLGRVLADDRSDGAARLTKGIALALLPLAAIAVAAGTFSPFLYYRF